MQMQVILSDSTLPDHLYRPNLASGLQLVTVCDDGMGRGGPSGFADRRPVGVAYSLSGSRKIFTWDKCVISGGPL